MLTHEILAKYHSRRKEDLEACRKSFAVQDLAIIERIGHRLKGNGVTFGYPELSKLGEDMEMSARNADLSTLRSSIESLEGWVIQHEDLFREA